MKIRNDLPRPTMQLAEEKIKQFEQDNGDVEHGLKELMQALPKNNDIGHVLVKVAAINGLYATAIFGLTAVAKVIRDADIDPLLDSGDPGAVEKIARVTY